MRSGTLNAPNETHITVKAKRAQTLEAVGTKDRVTNQETIVDKGQDLEIGQKRRETAADRERGSMEMVENRETGLVDVETETGENGV